MTNYNDWDIEPTFEDLAWTDEVDDEEYPYEVVDENWVDGSDWYPEWDDYETVLIEDLR